MNLILPGAIFVAVGLLAIIVLALLIDYYRCENMFLALSTTDHYIASLDKLYKAEQDMACR